MLKLKCFYNVVNSGSVIKVAVLLIVWEEFFVNVIPYTIQQLKKLLTDQV